MRDVDCRDAFMLLLWLSLLWKRRYIYMPDLPRTSPTSPLVNSVKIQGRDTLYNVSFPQSCHISIQDKGRQKVPYPLYTLIHPSHTLSHQKLLQSHLRIKPSPSTRLDTTMWQRRFILDRHAVDMHRPALISINLIKKAENGGRTYPD